MLGPIRGIVLVFWALREAAREGNLVKVMDLVSDGARMDASHSLGRTPLHEAALHGHLSIVKFLLEETDASVHAVDAYESATPLHEACKGGHLPVLRYLVESAKADMFHLDTAQRSALHKACVAGYLDIARYLVEHDSPQRTLIDGRDKHGLCPLHDACSNGRLPIVQYLIRQGRARVHDQGVSGDTPLHFAVLQGHVDVARFLLQDLVPHVRVDIRNRDGMTPLDMVHQSRSSRRVDMMNFIDQWNGVTAVAGAGAKAKILVEKDETFEYKPEDTMTAGKASSLSEDATASRNHPTRLQYPTSSPPLHGGTLEITPKGETLASVPVESMTMASATENQASAVQGNTMPVKSRITRLEEQFQLNSIDGTVIDRIAALEKALFGQTGQGTISRRLNLLEDEMIDWGRILRLEKILEIKTNEEASLFDRIAAMEMELLGAKQGGSLAIRLSSLEAEVVDLSRLGRLEKELEIHVAQGTKPFDRILTLERALFGEGQKGTMATRLSLLEEQLVG